MPYGQAFTHTLQDRHFLGSTHTVPSSSCWLAPDGQQGTHSGFSQCMHSSGCQDLWTFGHVPWAPSVTTGL